MVWAARLTVAIIVAIDNVLCSGILTIKKFTAIVMISIQYHMGLIVNLSRFAICRYKFWQILPSAAIFLSVPHFFCGI